jgi:hypothetical protein
MTMEIVSTSWVANRATTHESSESRNIMQNLMATVKDTVYIVHCFLSCVVGAG